MYEKTRPIAPQRRAAKDEAERRRARSGPSSGLRTRDIKVKKVINRKSLLREVRYTLWRGLQQLLKNLITKQQITIGVMNTSSSNQKLLFGASSEIANPVTHSATDFFESPSVLMNYIGSSDQEVFPQEGFRGPQVNFLSHQTIKTAFN